MVSPLRRLMRKIRLTPRKVGYVWGPPVMSRLRKWWVLFRHPHAHIVFEEPVYLGPGFSLDIRADGEFIVGQAVEFRRGFRAEVHPGASLRIGAHSHFTYDVLIQCGTSIEIGEHCMFGQAAGIFDDQHNYRELDKPMLEQGYEKRSLKIADHVTTTTKCTILADIGTRAFVGANSVVTRAIPAYCLAVGVPARVVDYFGPPGSEPPEWLESSRYGAAGPNDGSAGSSSSQAARKPGASA